MSTIQSKVTRHAKKQDQGKRGTVEADPQMFQILNLADGSFKITLVVCSRKSLNGVSVLLLQTLYPHGFVGSALPNI